MMAVKINEQGKKEASVRHCGTIITFTEGEGATVDHAEGFEKPKFVGFLLYKGINWETGQFETDMGIYQMKYPNLMPELRELVRKYEYEVCGHTNTSK